MGGGANPNCGTVEFEFADGNVVDEDGTCIAGPDGGERGITEEVDVDVDVVAARA